MLPLTRHEREALADAAKALRLFAEIFAASKTADPCHAQNVAARLEDMLRHDDERNGRLQL